MEQLLALVGDLRDHLLACTAPQPSTSAPHNSSTSTSKRRGAKRTGKRRATSRGTDHDGQVGQANQRV